MLLDHTIGTTEFEYLSKITLSRILSSATRSLFNTLCEKNVCMNMVADTTSLEGAPNDLDSILRSTYSNELDGAAILSSAESYIDTLYSATERKSIDVETEWHRGM